MTYIEELKEEILDKDIEIAKLELELANRKLRYLKDEDLSE